MNDHISIAKMELEKCVLWLFILIAKISSIMCSTNPPLHHNWTRSEKMDPNGILQFQWHLRDKEIVFKVTVNSRGFIAIGFLYQNPKFSGFDMALAWIDDRTGKANILVGFFLHRRVSNLHETFAIYSRYRPKERFKRQQSSIMKNAFSKNMHFEFPFYNDSLVRVRINSI